MSHPKRTIMLKRVYDDPSAIDGVRVLVDRLWPRAHVEVWLKEVAPSNDLRKWFGHDPEKFAEFRRRYEAELTSGPAQEALAKLHEMAKHRTLTLLFAAHDKEHCNATVLYDLLIETR
jgi:uncharacterized protein YeaO (DUF488 family)